MYSLSDCFAYMYAVDLHTLDRVQIVSWAPRVGRSAVQELAKASTAKERKAGSNEGVKAAAQTRRERETTKWK